jgi:hypothetical protein
VAQLSPGGLLALEELDTMVGSSPALQRYYTIVEALQRAHGQDMHVGRALPALASEACVRVVRDQVVRLTLEGHRMARIHCLNLQTWKPDAFIRSHYPAADIDALEAELGALPARPDPAVFVDYYMRQMVVAAEGRPSGSSDYF